MMLNPIHSNLKIKICLLGNTKNTEYEERIRNEILVDCRDEYEQNMSWFYYVQEEMDFSFEAQIELRKREGGKVLKKVRVISLSNENPDFERSLDLKVDVELDDYIIGVSLAELTDIMATEGTIEAVKIWKYWINL